jgi:flagellar basal-body rod modification protein FlgD
VVDPVNAVAGQAVALDPSLLLDGSTSARTATSTLDKEAFLKLLVAQLKYQDPMNPASNEEFIATTAQFTTIEKLDELATQSAISSQVNALATASALIGREITVLDADGSPQTTTVLRGEFAAGQLTLQTGRGPVTLDQVVSLAAAPAAPPATPSTPTTEPDTPPTDASATTESSTS